MDFEHCVLRELPVLIAESLFRFDVSINLDLTGNKSRAIVRWSCGPTGKISLSAIIAAKLVFGDQGRIELSDNQQVFGRFWLTAGHPLDWLNSCETKAKPIEEIQMTPRRVKITITKHGYFVEYLDRKRGQRHCAAQFTHESEIEGVPRTIEDVKNWVKQQKHLILDEMLA